MQVEPLRAEYQDRDARARGDGRAGPRRGAAVPDARVRRRGGARARHPGDDGAASPRSTAGSRRTGASRTRTASSRAPMLSLADPDAALAELDSLLERGARIVHIRPAPVPGAQRHQPLARRQAATTRCGPASPRRRSRSRSTSATAATTRSPARGAAARTSRLRQHDSLEPGARRRPRHPRHDRVAGRRTACSTATRRCASPASRTAPTGCTLLVKRLRSRPTRRRGSSPRTRSTRSAQHVWVTPYCEEDLARARRPHRRRAHPVRLRLAARRGPRRSRSTSSKELDGFDDAEMQQDHARQRARAARHGGDVTDVDDRADPDSTTSSGDEVDGLARRALGPRPAGRRVVAHGRPTPAGPRRTSPLEQGGRGLHRRSQARRARRRSRDYGALPPARRARACSWPRPTILTHGTPEQIDAPRPADPRGQRRLVPAVQRAGRRLRPRRPHHPGRRATATAGSSTARRCGAAMAHGVRLRHAARPHRLRRAQAPGHLVVRVPARPARRHHPAAARDDRATRCSTRCSSTTRSCDDADLIGGAGQRLGGHPDDALLRAHRHRRRRRRTPASP